MRDDKLYQILIFTALLLFLTMHEAAASVVDCKVVDTEINELLETVTVIEGQKLVVPRERMAKYLPGELSFLISNHSGRAHISESKPGIVKKEEFNKQYVQTTYTKLKYSIQCTYPYKLLPSLVESKKSKGKEV